ncbi:MAG: hypothetical protein MHM6MM_006465 [Cercozoa sp. M6MM]
MANKKASKAAAKPSDSQKPKKIIQKARVIKKKRNVIRGKNKSGRTWKKVETAPTRDMHQKSQSALKTQKDSYARKEELKRIQEAAAELKEFENEKRREEARRREQKRLQMEENARKGLVVQVITNTEKLKKMKKKHLLQVRTMDTTLL